MQIAIIGAGNMGSGIAQAYAAKGFHTTVIDQIQSQIDKSKTNIKHSLQEGVERRIFSAQEAAAILDRLLFASELKQAASADLIIEAIFENEAAKQQLFHQLDKICKPSTIFASNTSSFYVKNLFKDLNPNRQCVGLHYFYHPAKNKLVEVIQHPNTPVGTFEQIWALQENIGKIPIASKDSPGFVVNRFFVPWLNESVRMLSEGVANIASIDACAKQAFQIGMGPFELMNVTGVPITFHAANSLARELGEFYTPCPLLKSTVEANQQWDLSGTIQTSCFEQISKRLLNVVFDIAQAMVLKEKVCTLDDCDLGARLGLRWKKGPFELMNNPELMPSFVSASVDEQVGYITLNRPDTLNILNSQSAAQLGACFSRLEADPNVRALVIQGRGKAFAAGADVGFFVDRIVNKQIDEIVNFASNCQQLFKEIDDCRKPVVCAMNGLTLGGGLELALACDAIVASTSAKMGFPETKIGIYPGLGGTQRTPRRVGVPLARWLILSGKTLSAEQALDIGLIDAICAPQDLEQTAKKMALKKAAFAELAQPQAHSTAQQMADRLIALSGTTPLAQGLTEETAGLARIFATPEALMGLQSVSKSN